jgi:hypothetical protein
MKPMKSDMIYHLILASTVMNSLYVSCEVRKTLTSCAYCVTSCHARSCK